MDSRINNIAHTRVVLAVCICCSSSGSRNIANTAVAAFI
jgi:hypothetical protein